MVTITGTNFTDASAVLFDLRDAESFTVVSDTSITAISPPQVGSRGFVDVTVITPNGVSSVGPEDRFGYGPVFNEMSPDGGPAAGGTAVTIRGFGLQEATAVNFGSSAAASFSENPDGSITAVSPPVTEGSTVVGVTVLTPRGDSQTYSLPDSKPANFFTYGPTVASVDPGEGPAGGGTKVTIHGNGFSSPLFLGLGGPFIHAVDFGSAELQCGSPWPAWLAPCGSAQFAVKSDSEIVAVAPPGTGTVAVRVVTEGGTSPDGSSDLFTYEPQGEAANVKGSGLTSGLVQLVNCKAAANAVHLRDGKRGRLCTSRLVAGSVGAGRLSARLVRRGLLYGAGTAAVRVTNTRLVLNPVRQVTPGRYRLTLSSPSGTRHQLLTIR